MELGYSLQTSGDIERTLEILRRTLHELGLTPVVTDDQPTIDALQAVRDQLLQLTSALEQATARSTAQINHVNSNIVAIIFNLKVRPGEQFLPLRDLQNQPILGFPANHVALAALSDAEVDRILTSLVPGYGGDADTKRMHLEQYIGAWRLPAHSLGTRTVNRTGRR